VYNEERASAVSHAVGLLASLVGAPILIVLAARHRDPWAIMTVSIYSLCLVNLYATSTIFHALPEGHTKLLWQRLDHVAIYLLIAGTYTPFTLGALRGPWGWSLFGIVWAFGAVGIIAELWYGPRWPALSTFVYLGMGWLVLVAIRPLFLALGWSGFSWLLAGGIAYSLGVIFYVNDRRVRGGHLLWHLFVMGGSFCHFVAVMKYAATMR
jgi:hemolysin III